MNNLINEHPSEDTLVSYAVQDVDTGIEEHIAACSSCSEYIEDIRDIKRGIEGLPEVDVPEAVRKAILKNIRSRSFLPGTWFHFDILTWYKNPFLLGIGAVLFILFLYIFFVFLL